MTDHQFELLTRMLSAISAELHAIRGHLGKQVVPDVVLVGERGPEIMSFGRDGGKQSAAQ